jgi:hypothetical protein
MVTRPLTLAIRIGRRASVLLVRAALVSIVMAACGSPPPEVKSAGSGPVRSDKPAVPPPDVEPTVVAVIAGDHLKVLALAPTTIAVQRDIKLPTTPEAVRWLDRDHLVVVDRDGKAYVVTGDSVAAYRMPPASAWRVKPRAGEERATFPMKLTLARTTAGVELASCATYYMGDDDPCVTWGVVSLGTALEVGAVTTQADALTDDVTEREIVPARSGAQPTIEWKDNADGMHAGVALKLGTSRRDWSSEEPCPIIDANTKWLSESPPIIAFVTTSDCGEGGPHDEEHLLRLPSLADFSPGEATLVLGPALWARNAEGGWKLLSGDRVVGSLDGIPVMQPSNDPTGPVVATPSPSESVASHLALRRGEKLRRPSTEMEWKTPAGTMRATVVDVIYKDAKHKAPISKLVVWNTSKRFDIVRTTRACDVLGEVRVANDMVLFRCGSRPVGDEPEGMIEDWLIRWSVENRAPLRNKHWSGDPAADEPAWARDSK